MTTMRKFLIAAGTLLAAIVFSLYEEVPYYWKAYRSHQHMVSSGELIEDIVREKRDFPDNLEEKLKLVPGIVSFATDRLKLENKKGSYHHYVNVGEVVAWNVVLAPEFGLEARRWCRDTWLHRIMSLFIGCFSYRGFPTKKEANAYASFWREKGYEVYVYPISAYSTRGYSSDPVTSSMLQKSKGRLAESIFHEFAHGTVSYKRDTAIDESFGNAVGEISTCIFLKETDPEEAKKFVTAKQSERIFIALLRQTRERLKSLYEKNGGVATGVYREEKEKIFDMLREEAHAAGLAIYKDWLENGLNNAKIAGISLYHSYIPAFLNLFVKTGRNMEEFYRKVREIFALPNPEEALRRLGASREREPCDFALATP